MIKRILIIFIALLQFFFVLLPVQIYAQTPTVPQNIDKFVPDPDSNVPGLTCGNARVASISRCCVAAPPKSLGKEVAESIPQFACLIDTGSLIPGIPIISDVTSHIPVVNLIPGFGGDDSGPSIRGLCVSDIFKDLIKDYLDDTKPVKEINRIKADFPIDQCVHGDPVQGGSGSCQCVESVGAGALCKKYLDSGSSEFKSCESCSVKGGVWTAAGCFYTNASLLISESIIPWGLGLAGSMSLLCISYAAFILQTSRGNPERIKKAREYLRACITGLLLIIFSVFILQLIGVTILRIPGFQ